MSGEQTTQGVVAARANGPSMGNPEVASDPTVLMFTDGGATAEIFQQHVPPGWAFEFLADRDDEAEKLARLRRADVLFQMDVPLTSDHLDAASSLRLVHRQGVGLDALDLDDLRRRGVSVCICPVGTPEAVAEHAIMLAMAAGRRLTELHDGVRAGGWPKWEHRGHSVGLAGSTVGIVGFGRIGQAVARRLLPFECRLLVARQRNEPLGPDWPAGQVQRSDLDEVFRRSDIVTLHCPLTPDTRGLVDAPRLATMRPGSVLVNTSRGGLVVEEDLAAALRQGQPAVAGLDVLSEEPPGPGHPLVGLPNALVTPHCGAGVAGVQHRKAEVMFENVQRLVRGEELRYRVC